MSAFILFLITKPIGWVTIACFGWVFSCTWNKNDVGSSIVLGAIFGGLASLFFMACMMGVIISTSPFSGEHDELVSKTPIYSVRNSDELSGSASSFFFVGSGNIGTKNYYISYIDTDKGIKMVKYDAAETFLKENVLSADLARVDKWETVKTRKLRLPWFIGKSEIKEHGGYYNVLHVPQGTILRKFALE